jgi:hypothetical protein
LRDADRPEARILKHRTKDGRDGRGKEQAVSPAPCSMAEGFKNEMKLASGSILHVENTFREYMQPSAVHTCDE